MQAWVWFTLHAPHESTAARKAAGLGVVAVAAAGTLDAAANGKEPPSEARNAAQGEDATALNVVSQPQTKQDRARKAEDDVEGESLQDPHRSRSAVVAISIDWTAAALQTGVGRRHAPAKIGPSFVLNAQTAVPAAALIAARGLLLALNLLAVLNRISDRAALTAAAETTTHSSVVSSQVVKKSKTNQKNELMQIKGRILLSRGMLNTNIIQLYEVKIK